MKYYFVLAVTFTVAQAVTHGLTNTPLSNFRNIPGAYQGRLGYSGNQGLLGRQDYRESLHQEAGNFYGGQREGRYLTRDNRDNVRGLQYSIRPNREYGYYPREEYQQQNYRPSQGIGYGSSYADRNPQITFTAPLANTRSYNPRFDAPGNRQSGHRFY